MARTRDFHSRRPGFESSCCRFEACAISFNPPSSVPSYDVAVMKYLAIETVVDMCTNSHSVVSVVRNVELDARA